MLFFPATNFNDNILPLNEGLKWFNNKEMQPRLQFAGAVPSNQLLQCELAAVSRSLPNSRPQFFRICGGGEVELRRSNLKFPDARAELIRSFTRMLDGALAISPSLSMFSPFVDEYSPIFEGQAVINARLSDLQHRDALLNGVNDSVLFIKHPHTRLVSPEGSGELLWERRLHNGTILQTDSGIATYVDAIIARLNNVREVQMSTPVITNHVLVMAGLHDYANGIPLKIDPSLWEEF